MVLSGNPVGSKWQPHGDVHYYVDALGARVGTLPATCRRGLHSLHEVGYQAYQHASHVSVRCDACQQEIPPPPNAYWALRTTPPLPDRAELDDTPYRDLIPRS
nr:hypothetical protein [Kibdelosporangium sp. MJ126-NF4]